MEPKQVDQSVQEKFLLFACGCTILNANLESALDGSRRCPKDLNPIEVYIPASVFKAFLERQKAFQEGGELSQKGNESLQKAKKLLSSGALDKAFQLYIELIKRYPKSPETEEFITTALQSQIEHEESRAAKTSEEKDEAETQHEVVSEIRAKDILPYYRKISGHSLGASSNRFSSIAKSKQQQKHHPIYNAAQEGNLRLVEFFIKKDRKLVNSGSSDGCSPLIAAIQHNHESVVKLLLTNGAKSTRLPTGYEPLHCALQLGSQPIVEMLLDYSEFRSNLNTCSEEGGTPLMIASGLENSLSLVKLLVAKGADPSIQRKDGMTALEMALKRDEEPTFRYLLSLCNPESHAIQTAVSHGPIRLLAILKEHPCFESFKNSYGDTPLHMAIRSGNVMNSLWIIENCHFYKMCVSNSSGETPLSLAISGSFWELIDVLFKKGTARRDLYTNSPKSRNVDVSQSSSDSVQAKTDFSDDVGVDFSKYLNNLMRIGYHPVLKKIFDCVVLPPERIEELLNIAATAGHHQTISSVLQPKGANLKALKGPNGWGALHYFAKSDGLFLFRSLLEGNEDILCPDTEGKTIPYIAAENGSFRVLSWILPKLKTKNSSLSCHFKGKHIFYAVMKSAHTECIGFVLDLFREDDLLNIPLDGRGTRAAHLAAQKGALKVLKILNKRKANFVDEDTKGTTPLCYAIAVEAPEAVKFLLRECKVPVTAKALYTAAKLENPKILQLLISYAPDLNVKTKLGNTALFLAVSSGNKVAFINLLNAGASLEVVCQNGWTPLHFAAAHGHTEILSMILPKVLFTESLAQGYNPLHWACKNGHVGAVRKLLLAGYLTTVKSDQNLLSLVGKQKGVKHALGIGEQEYGRQVEEFFQALDKEDLQIACEQLLKLPIDEKIEFYFQGRLLAGTPLHFLLHTVIRSGSPKRTFDALNTFIHLIGSSPIDPNLEDSEGNTFAHLLLLANISLKELPESIFKKIDLKKTNRKKATLLHVAAKSATNDAVVFLLSKDPTLIDQVDIDGRTPIFYAISGRNLKNIRALLAKGADKNFYDNKLMTPLFLACETFRLDIVKILVESGADLNQVVTIDAVTPLHIALIKEKMEIVRYLMFHGAKCDRPSADGSYLAHVAAIKAKVEVIQTLAARGLSLESRNHDGIQPVHLAASGGSINVLSFLKSLDPSTLESRIVVRASSFKKVKESSKSIFRGADPLLLAALYGESKTVRWLLNQRVNLETKNDVGFGVLAVAANSPALLSVLKSYDLSQKTENIIQAIRRAILEDNVHSLKLLYSFGVPYRVPLNGEGMTSLHLASLFGSVQCTDFLLNQGLDPFEVGFSGSNSLEISCAGNSTSQFKRILDYCFETLTFDLKQYYSHGETLLHKAVKQGRLANVILLIQRGASLNVKDASEMTPLHHAVKNNLAPIVKMLLACGASLYMPSFACPTPFDLSQKAEGPVKATVVEFCKHQALSRPGDSLLHLAVRMKNILAIGILSEILGPNVRNENGSTPLHLAVEMAQLEAIKQLLKEGADAEAKDIKGRTPLEVMPHEVRKSSILQLFKECRV